ncbi:hypothetical protein EDC05_001255 [Coemansia umbellata]|uniref:PWI domain-containing protein n=1 Tax=Coemansia umbellata TaxID=1424467 RepID=A0ABQ8PSY3_9FUNG|nr:hypothetical protein EDC05_001255 [Coemansia umbellata]
MRLHEWISDTIIDIVGESSSEIVDYVLHLASTCTSEDALKLIIPEKRESATLDKVAGAATKKNGMHLKNV